MKTKKLPLVVKLESPFEGDALSREKPCKDLADFIAEAETPYVLAVDAPWGAGKTVFAQMLRAECRNQQLPTVFFDAWKADFHDDALAAMVGEISEEFKSKNKFANAVRETGKALISRQMMATGLKTIGNAVGAGALVEGMDKALQKFDVAEEYRKRREALKKFQEALTGYAEQNGGRLVFFVDELDRCRPIFAVEVLEKIKHVFDAKGVFFVVSVHKEQLGKTIKSVYGDIDEGVYLRKFFDRDYPLVNRSGFIASVLKNLGFIEHINRRNELLKLRVTPHHLEDEIERIAALCDAYGFSLRDCEQVAHRFASAMMSVDHKQLTFPDITGFFAAMSVAAPLEFKKYQDVVANMNVHPNAYGLSEFPYAELAEYYKKIVGCDFEHEEETEKIRYLQWTYTWCCANRYLVDSEYRQTVDDIDKSDTHPSHSYMSWMRGLAKNPQSTNGGFPFYKGILPHPKSVIEAVARIGKRQFIDSNEEK